MLQPAISNVIPTPLDTGLKVLAFDQGGIYIGVDYDLTIKALEKLGATNADALYTQIEQTFVIDEFERGKCTKKDFYHYLRNNLHGLKTTVTDHDLYVAWNAMLTGVIPGVLEFIQELRNCGYITVVVSNADIIHQEGVEQQINESNATQLFNDNSFNKKYISYQFGFNKPFVEIFHAITRDLQQTFPDKKIQPAEILFIDDSKKHIDGRNLQEGAKNVGWQGLLVPSNLKVAAFKKEILHALQKIKQHRM